MPEWVKDAVFYQIFPERFCNGDPSNDPPGTRPWGGKPGRNRFFGGDLQGIIDRVPHLEWLGVNAVYLTPIFKARTTHKYDTVDYRTIDPHFGDLTVFRNLVDRMHSAGIRVVLDAVFHHTGYYHPAFRDVVLRGADSRFLDWYFVRELPVRRSPRPNYQTFDTTWYLPRLNLKNPDVETHLLRATDYWTRQGIDGWRLDVADRVDRDFWRKFGGVVRSINPDAYVVGEVWGDARDWLWEGLFDGVTNYVLRDIVLDFAVRRRSNGAEFAARLLDHVRAYPAEAVYQSLSLLGSHDTARILTLCRGNRGRLLLAVTLVFSLPGAPIIYYGDEVGMRGRNDPDCRRCMIWDESAWDAKILAVVRALVGLRRRSEALRRGCLETIPVGAPAGTGAASGRLVALARRATDEDYAVLVANAEDRAIRSVRVCLPEWARGRAFAAWRTTAPAAVRGPETAAACDGTTLLIERLGPCEAMLLLPESYSGWSPGPPNPPTRSSAPPPSGSSP